MPDQQRFSYISVSSDEGDDVVIHAGASAHGAAAPASHDGQAPADAAARPDAAADAAAQEEEPARPDAADLAAAERATAEPDGYRPTTLEDLEGKAPVVQRVVIVAALLLIVAVIVYQVAFA